VSAFTSNLTSAFGISLFEVNLAINCSAAIYLPAFFVTVYMFNRMSCHAVLSVASITMFVGAWVRMLAVINNEYWFIIAGQAIVASAGPMVTGAISIIANNWFGDKERAFATAIMSLSNPLGSLASFVIQGVYAYSIDKKIDDLGPDPPQDQTNEMVRNGVYNLLLVESIMITVCVIFFFIVFRTKPDTPPSAAAMAKQADITEGMCKDIAKLFLNVNYVLIFVIFSCMYTVYAGLGFVINPLLTPYGYTPTQISAIGVVFVLTGSTASVLAGMFLDRTKKYLFTLRLVPCVSTLAAMIGFFLVPTGIFLWAAVTVGIAGFMMVPIISVSYNFATEVTHPV
jgi:MFS transporter, FLVCR family, feline leukemia virus subgroup C receptor-related protein